MTRAELIEQADYADREMIKAWNTSARARSTAEHNRAILHAGAMAALSSRFRSMASERAE